MITKFNNYKLITEDPDFVYVDDGEGYDLSENDALPFECTEKNNKVEEMFFGEHGTFHDEMEYNQGISKKSYPGRLWLDSKIMAFWVYPNDKLFRSIIHSIEDHFQIKIFHNGWRIEVIMKKKGKMKRKKKQEDSYMNTGGYENATIIPLDEYTGSEDVPEELKILHLMNWKEKELAKKIGKIHFGGKFGSNLTAWDQPHNIKWRQAMYQEKKKNI